MDPGGGGPRDLRQCRPVAPTVEGSLWQRAEALQAAAEAHPAASVHSRWSLLEAVDQHPDPAEARARQLLRRYGMLFPELLAREPMAPRCENWCGYCVGLEARGEIRGGGS